MVGRFVQSAAGLIPAWAGKTVAKPVAAGAIRAHPRVGGENQAVTEPLIFVGGSSPRGRGKRRRAPGVSHEHGLIPAWAGKTTLSNRSD